MDAMAFAKAKFGFTEAYTSEAPKSSSAPPSVWYCIVGCQLTTAYDSRNDLLFGLVIVHCAFEVLIFRAVTD